MAAISYGTIIFKNGYRYKPDELFPIIDELDIRLYKNTMNKDSTNTTIKYFGWEDKKSYRFEYENSKFWVKEICPRVYKCEIITATDKYFVVFGYAIDSNKKIWDEIKFRFLGKKNAKKVDRVLDRYKVWG